MLILTKMGLAGPTEIPADRLGLCTVSGRWTAAHGMAHGGVKRYHCMLGIRFEMACRVAAEWLSHRFCMTASPATVAMIGAVLPTRRPGTMACSLHRLRMARTWESRMASHRRGTGRDGCMIHMAAMQLWTGSAWRSAGRAAVMCMGVRVLTRTAEAMVSREMGPRTRRTAELVTRPMTQVFRLRRMM